MLAIKFRLVKKIDFPVSLKDLLDNNVVKAAPQSIMEMGDSCSWLREEIGV